MAEPDWEGAKAPDLAEFERVARAAYARLPAEFRRMTRDVSIRIVDFPEQDVRDVMGRETEYDLLGLFVGVGLAQDAAAPESGRLPNMIFLYRRPILDYWAEHDETLGSIVTHVLVHEIGHHFGFSDADMEAIEAGTG